MQIVRRMRNGDRLEKLGLFTLEKRMLQGGLVDIFQIINGRDRVDREKLYPLVEGLRAKGR